MARARTVERERKKRSLATEFVVDVCWGIVALPMWIWRVIGAAFMVVLITMGMTTKKRGYSPVHRSDDDGSDSIEMKEMGRADDDRIATLSAAPALQQQPQHQHQQKAKAQSFRPTIVILVNIVISIAQIIFNKVLLRRWPFPASLTTCHMITSWLLSGVTGIYLGFALPE